MSSNHVFDELAQGLSPLDVGSAVTDCRSGGLQPVEPAGVERFEDTVESFLS